MEMLVVGREPGGGQAPKKSVLIDACL